MGPRSHHTAQEGDAFCLLEMYFGAKSATQSQNSSKGPCEDAGGNPDRKIKSVTQPTQVTNPS